MLTDKYRYPLVIPDGSLSDSDEDGDLLHSRVGASDTTVVDTQPGDMFVIDTKPEEMETSPIKKEWVVTEKETNKKHNKKKLKYFTETSQLSSSLQSKTDMSGYLNLSPEDRVSTVKNDEKLRSLAISLSKRKDLTENSVMKPGFEQLTEVPGGIMGKRKAKRLRKLERGKTKGASWYNLPATELTEENKTDLELMMMQDTLDNTKYRKPDLKALPKYYQVGRIQEDATDFYHARIPKKERSKTLVDELLADAEFQRRSKKKLKDIQIKERKATISSKINRKQRKVDIAKFKESRRKGKAKRKAEISIE